MNQEEVKQEENVIEIENLTKSYKMYNSKRARLLEAILPKYQKHTEFKALNNLNLTVKKGEILGILGKNGAGKSTLLKLITGVAVQTSRNYKNKWKNKFTIRIRNCF